MVADLSELPADADPRVRLQSESADYGDYPEQAALLAVARRQPTTADRATQQPDSATVAGASRAAFSY